MAETTNKKPGNGAGTLRGDESGQEGHAGQGSYGQGGQNPDIGVGQPHNADEGRKASDDNERDESANPDQPAEDTDE